MLTAMSWSDRTFPGRDLVVMKQLHLLQFVCSAVIVFFFISPGLAQSGASYTAQRRIDTITVDGRLTEASWANAVNCSIFTIWDGSPAPAALQTSAKMVWDDQYLFIAFNAKDPDVYATYVGRDVRCWDQDNFEVFVTVPGTTGYVEAEGSPTGAIWDGFWTNVGVGGASYTMTNLQVGGYVSGTLNNSADQDVGFTSEIRLPFSDIYQVSGGHPTNGTQLRLNLNRINWNTPVVQGGAGASGSRTYHTWSPMPGSKADFHQPNKFGTVTFSTNPVPAPTWKFTGGTFSDNKLVLSGVGHTGGTYCVLVSTNAALATTHWTRIATNTFDSVTGQFRFTNTIAPVSPQLFYRLQSP
jgi:hypothetical protein